MIKLVDILTEGVYDPGIFKAVFTAGGPGSGKSFAAAITFMVSNFSWLWLPILWTIGGAVLDAPGRYLLTKAGLKDTGTQFGIHTDLETAKAYFNKNSIFK